MKMSNIKVQMNREQMKNKMMELRGHEERENNGNQNVKMNMKDTKKETR